MKLTLKQKFFIFVFALLTSMGVTYMMIDAIQTRDINARKQGEDIGYQIGWEVGSNACRTNK